MRCFLQFFLVMMNLVRFRIDLLVKFYINHLIKLMVTIKCTQ